MDSGKTTTLADCLLLWGSSILFVEKKEGKERGQTNRETGGKTACDSWDPAHPARHDLGGEGKARACGKRRIS